MKSYIKIYGPPVLKAIKALEKIAVDLPQVCIMDSIMSVNTPLSEEDVRDYFGQVSSIPKERCDKIISKSGEKLGEYDFYFEWFIQPTQKQVNDLIEDIDNALTPLNCKYTITTK